MKYFTTLRKLREHGACADRYGFLAESLGQDWDDDAKISIQYILNNNGLDDAIWALRAVDGIDVEMILFACDCAEHVLHIYESRHPGDDRPRKALQARRDFAIGKVKEEVAAVAWTAKDALAVEDAAWDACWAAWTVKDALAAKDVSWAVVWAAWAVSDAVEDAVWAASGYALRAVKVAGFAAWNAEIKWQEKQFIRYFVECKEVPDKISRLLSTSRPK